MTLSTLTHFVALLSVLVMLGSAAATAGHLHEDDDARHDCALCAAGFLNPSIAPQSAPSPCLTAALSVPPGPQGPSWHMRYRAHLLSRAPPT